MKIIKVAKEIRITDPIYMNGLLFVVDYEEINFYGNTIYPHQNFYSLEQAKEYQKFLQESIGLDLDYSEKQIILKTIYK